eukprot:TRINITY_DN5125_c0_g1_i1.p1 TRINITY_DN5125_c0_g1~~TRINITY_DN5125_c0_g1_i1.p1  ORF type:complete len:241 (+),score=46.71 TRINITY_DN5125_c0_g1_i1:114-836(+)
MADQIKEWWNTVPIVTRWLFALSAGLTTASQVGLASGGFMILNWERIWSHYEIYRLLTCFFFYGGFSFSFLMLMVFLLRYSHQLEQVNFLDNTADYLFFLLFGGVVLLVATFFYNMLILGPPLVMYIIYVWARKNPNLPMSFMFGLRFQSFWFPWVLVGFHTLTGGNPIPDTIGIVIGHLYYFLTEIYPNTGGQRYLQTPKIMYTWFPHGYRPDVAGRGRPQPAEPQGRQWGEGARLGGR